MKSIFTFFVLSFLFLLGSLEVNGQTLAELMQKGDKYYSEFNHNKALQTYLLADSLNPANWVLMWKISRAYVDLAEKMPEETGKQEDAKEAEFEKALFYADSSVKLAHGEAETYVRRAIANGKLALFAGIFSAIGKVNDVKDDCEKAIELGNGGNYVQALAHYVLGRGHLKVCEKAYLLRLPLGLGWGDMDDAIRELETAVKLRPNFRMFYLELARAYFEEDEYEKAKENILLLQKAPFVDEDDDTLLIEAKKLLDEINAELE
jgi:tetratricopeptide (TPR) repeat protein